MRDHQHRGHASDHARQDRCRQCRRRRLPPADAWTLTAAPNSANQTSGVTGAVGNANVTNKPVKVGQKPQRVQRDAGYTTTGA